MINKIQKIKRACVQDYPVDLLSMEEATNIIQKNIEKSKSTHVVTINPEMIKQAAENPSLDKVLKEAEIVIPDGIGVVIALKLLGINIKRLPGIELATNLLNLAQMEKYKVAFLGADKETIEKANQEILKKYPQLNIVYKRNGYFNKDEEKLIVADIEKVSPDLLFVGLGVPAQEMFISKYKKNLNRTIMIGIGGSFDVWANKIKRAPTAFRKFGLEWFYRLITQPSRFKRMFPTLPLFLLGVIFKRGKNRKEY